MGYVPSNSDFVVFNASIDYNESILQREPNMSTLTVRNIDPALKERLRVRAAHNGRSMESEVRRILSDTLNSGTSREASLAEAIRRRFAPLGGVDLEPNPHQPAGEPPSFE